MDWLFDIRRDDATQAAVRAVEDHLLRHTSEQASVPPAVEEVSGLLRDARSAEVDGTVWLHLDWTRVMAHLALAPLDGQAPELPASGLRAVTASEAAHLSTNHSERLESALRVPREVVVSFDPDVGSLIGLDPLEHGPSAATGALAVAAETHPVASPDQVAAAAGALLADAAMHDRPLETMEDALAAITRLHEALGGSVHHVSAGPDRVELLVDRSPFGAVAGKVPSLTRISEAVAGRLAARVWDMVTVVHDESVALGDPADRLQLFRGNREDDVCGSVYAWPPAGAPSYDEPSPRLEMSVALPRQSHSVPVIRRLAAQVLRAFGVAADHIHDVELAITEACANVIQHAVDSDGYEVSIELAADRCALTVLDRGEGFHADDLGAQEDVDAETGRGLALMDALMDRLNFVSEPKVGAVVRMVKELEYEPNHPFRRPAAG